MSKANIIELAAIHHTVSSHKFNKHPITQIIEQECSPPYSASILKWPLPTGLRNISSGLDITQQDMDRLYAHIAECLNKDQSITNPSRHN